MPPETRLPEPAELARRLLTDTGPPIDVWAVAALLESRGIRDLDAREHYGEADVFGLARRVHDLTQTDGATVAAAGASAESVPRLPITKLLIRGGFFVASLVTQLVSLLLVGYSQWASFALHSRRSLDGGARGHRRLRRDRRLRRRPRVPRVVSCK